ncbi:MAG TPA: hypothetical protein VFX22_11065 [Candidatus Kapabacteria bacterium]|nr:hypothetical protein [Candidatus Kapabacteria bacterium]
MRRIFETMTTRRIGWTFALTLLFCASRAVGQGMTLDSELVRIGSGLQNPALAAQLRDLIPDYANAHVWGLATGDFSNDSLPDLALSLYDAGRARNSVRVYFFENVNNKKLADRFEREIPYVESPIEVGLSIDSSVVTITRKIGENHWTQEGYSIRSGDVMLDDRFETQQENIAGAGNGKPHPLGHEVYRNYQTLRTRESYFTGTAGGSMLSESYFTLPAYERLREIYPGYGHLLSDTSKDFITEGIGLRRDATDLSIRSMQAAYDDDYLYLAVRVRDDYVTGGQPNISANDRVSFWFDTKYTGDRLNRDRRVLSEQGGFPTFRTSLDSLVSNLTFVLPAHPGKVTQITYSTVSPLTPLEQEGLNKVRAVMEYDTGRAVVDGYRLTLKIPFTFFGFESNPEHAYETPVPIGSKEETSDLASTASISNAATLGFTALIYDVDDPARPNEVTTQATSQYEAGNPSTFGTLVLEPSALYYGEVHPTYLEGLRKELQAAGY